MSRCDQRGSVLLCCWPSRPPTCLCLQWGPGWCGAGWRGPSWTAAERKHTHMQMQMSQTENIWCHVFDPRILTLIQGWFINRVMVILSLGSVFSSWWIKSFARRGNMNMITTLVVRHMQTYWSFPDVNSRRKYDSMTACPRCLTSIFKTSLREVWACWFNV